MPKFISDSKNISSAQKRIDEKFKNDWQFSLNVQLLELSEEISKQLVRRNLSRAQFAQLLGTSRSYVTQLLTGKPNLTLASLFKICSTIGLNPKMIFDVESFDPSMVEKGLTGTKTISTQAEFTIQEIPEYEKAN
jgi:transcriptional regulator with XRE-family HTH domain